MTEKLIPSHAEPLDDREGPGAEPGDMGESEDAHGRVDGVRAAVATAAGKTRDAADRAAGAARDQVDQHPRVAATVGRAVGTSGKAARAAGQQARRHPRIAGGLAAGGAVLLGVSRTLHRRRRPRATATGPDRRRP